MLKSTIIILVLLFTFVSTEKKCKCGMAPSPDEITEKFDQIGVENHPWLVQIGSLGPRDAPTSRFSCDGIVISPRHIITHKDCACKKNFKHTLFYGGDIFRGTYPGGWEGPGKSMPMNDPKCFEMENYQVVEVTEELPVQPICLAKDKVFDKNEKKAYKIFFYLMDEVKERLISRMQTRAINPNDIEFLSDQSIKTPQSGSANIWFTEPLVTVDGRGQWVLRGFGPLKQRLPWGNERYHNIGTDGEILSKSSEYFCFV